MNDTSESNNETQETQPAEPQEPQPNAQPQFYTEEESQQPSDQEQLAEFVGSREPETETISRAEHQRIVDSIKAGHKGTVSKQRQDYRQALARIKELEEGQTEGFYSALLEASRDDEGNLDYIRAVSEADKQTKKLYEETKTKAEALATLEQELNQAAIGKVAFDLCKQFKLDENEFAPALIQEAQNYADPTEGRLAMRNVALELSLKAEKSKNIPETVTDKGAGVPTGRITEGMSESEITGQALEDYYDQFGRPRTAGE